ncbi:PH domain-containing protein [Natronobiforma cellulositropha]|uniref:PH domain-containing protein n=1 Tax=Natronobiforma cellulositropha TaxID=1679076 RepID=UPI0021D58C61|nr:PH domain-containing protein [Natronobiforma cellulositropha]
MERLDPRVRPVWLTIAVIRAGFAGGFLVGGAAIVTESTDWTGGDVRLIWAAVAVAAFVLVFRVAVAWQRYRVWRFDVREDSLYIERGVFTRIKTVVPYVRLQHVDTQRGPVERSVGLATVVIYTAGSRSADVAIPGLDPERAEELREELRRLAIESEGEDAV